MKMKFLAKFHNERMRSILLKRILCKRPYKGHNGPYYIWKTTQLQDMLPLYNPIIPCLQIIKWKLIDRMIAQNFYEIQES